MKKTLAFIGALVIAFSAASCSSAQDKVVSSTIFTAEKLTNMAYKKMKLDLPETMTVGYKMVPYDGGERLMLLGAGESTPDVWVTDRTLSKYDRIEVEDFRIGVNYAFCVADDGTIVTFVVDADYGDLPDPDYSDPNFDQSVYDEAAEYRYLIRSYAPDGKLMSSAEVDSAFDSEPGKATALQEMCTDGRFVLVSIDGGTELFDLEGKYYGEIHTEETPVAGFGNDTSGAIVVAVEAEDDQLKMYTIGEDGKLQDTGKAYATSESLYGCIQPGCCGYKMFFRSNSSIYGIRSDDDSVEALFSTHASGLGLHDFQGYFMQDDGRFVVMKNDWINPTELLLFDPVDPVDIENQPVITIGLCAGGDQDSYITRDFITPWNDEHDEFRVELKYYKIDFDDPDKCFDQIAEDVLKGNLPDVLFLDNNGAFGRVNFLEKEGTCDLYEFLDKDDTLNCDSFVDNTLCNLEVNGKLPAITTRFSIEMGDVVKKKFLPNADQLTREARLDIIENAPEGVTFEEEMLTRAKWEGADGLYCNDWVDFEKGTCDFDDPSFLRFLKFCKQADIVERDWDHNDPTEGMTDDERHNYWHEQQIQESLAYIEDRALFGCFDFDSYGSYVKFLRGQFGGEEIVYSSEPKMHFGGQRGFMAISLNSDKKELAWEYIKSWFTDEELMKNCHHSAGWWSFEGPFPITKSGIKAYEEYERNNYDDYSNEKEYPQLKDDPKWKDYEGLVYTIDYDDPTRSIQVGPISDEDVAAVNDIISCMTPAQSTTLNKIDENYYNILDEELLRYFNDGCTAEQCADAIQSRMTIYLSERYSS